MILYCRFIIMHLNICFSLLCTLRIYQIEKRWRYGSTNVASYIIIQSVHCSYCCNSFIAVRTPFPYPQRRDTHTFVSSGSTTTRLEVVTFTNLRYFLAYNIQICYFVLIQITNIFLSVFSNKFPNVYMLR